MFKSKLPKLKTFWNFNGRCQGSGYPPPRTLVQATKQQGQTAGRGSIPDSDICSGLPTTSKSCFTNSILTTWNLHSYARRRALLLNTNACWRSRAFLPVRTFHILNNLVDFDKIRYCWSTLKFVEPNFDLNTTY